MELKDAGSKSQLLQKEDYRKKEIFSEYFKYILYFVFGMFCVSTCRAYWLVCLVLP